MNDKSLDIRMRIFLLALTVAILNSLFGEHLGFYDRTEAELLSVILMIWTSAYYFSMFVIHTYNDTEVRKRGRENAIYVKHPLRTNLVVFAIAPIAGVLAFIFILQNV